MRNKLQVFYIVSLLVFCCSGTMAQMDSVSKVSEVISRPKEQIKKKYYVKRQLTALDSAQLAAQKYQDSVAALRRARVADSLAFLYVTPISTRRNQFVDTLLRKFTIKDHLKAFVVRPNVIRNNVQSGVLREKGQTWLLLVSMGLVFLNLFANALMGRMLQMFSTAFLNWRFFYGQICNDNLIFRSWRFLVHYILSAFTLGFVAYYIVTHYSQEFNQEESFAYVMQLSLAVLLLFTLKIFLIRLLGFIFDVRKLLRPYLAALYVLFINMGIVSLAFLVVFLLLPGDMINMAVYLYGITLVLMVVYKIGHLVIRLLTETNSLMFSKFYLFVYLCTLEIAPILFLVRILGY